MSISSKAKKLMRLVPLMLMIMVVMAACGNSSTASTSNNVSNAKCAHPISLSQINFGLIPAENATQVLDQTKPFADALSKQVCKPVKLFVGNSYNATIEAMSSKKVDVALYGPLSYILAADKYNAEVILRQLTVDGADHYYSYIITNKKSGIKTLNDLKGKRFSFVDASSTSGNLVPRYIFSKNNIDPDKDMKSFYAGSHDVSVMSVISGKADAGAVASDNFDDLVSKGKFKKDDVVIIKKSDPLPEGPIAVRKELSQSDKDSIRAALLDIKDKAALNALVAGGFVKDTNDSYNGLRDMARVLGIDLKKLAS
ncbi:hypothetical protein KDA_64880 [Dictyobacter alpinus]|uniref:Phosphonate ABC transporter substrate-binding protein n=1 Tax=Dictyobacter alpinus TaxID=2014873 RepID=A0A402BHW8_9CHLR|nr:phosphate/phosphite/phosphonate ABC transporter substrate-binding protein [Dictyobacter alpinus]GCE31004.1 hypothetical protein KDA_64880 [Dictyobacter alpinus]